MDKTSNFFSSLLKVQNMLRSFFIVFMLFLIFFAISLLINIKNKPESAYNHLTSENERQEINLQDTRVHNWSELKKNR